MKKYLLVISIVFSLLANVNIKDLSVEITNPVIEECSLDDIKQSTVRIIDNYGLAKGSGVIYKTDDNDTYIVTSLQIISDTNNYEIEYSDGEIKKALVVEKEKYNGIAILRSDKKENAEKVCLANSDHLSRGQRVYVARYINGFFLQASTIQMIGELHSNKDRVLVFKNSIQHMWNDNLHGSGIYDEKGRLVGIINYGSDSLKESSFMCETNKIVKIADSVVKTSNYSPNYIKYSVVDFGSTSISLRKKYGVNENVKQGIIITSIKPLNYIFGGLNQGMVIQSVNGIEVKNSYDLDKQLSKYKKSSRVCLEVIKNNGKQKYYWVKI